MDDLRRWLLAGLVVVGLVLVVVGPGRTWDLVTGDSTPVPEPGTTGATVGTPAPPNGDQTAVPGGLPGPPGDAARGVVTRVSDGDTVRLDIIEGPAARRGTDVRGRLLRIDAPEEAHDGQPAECGARDATLRLAELVPDGTPVRIAWDVEPTDQYGRDLVHLWTDDGTWVNGVLLAEGRAREVLFAPNDGYDPKVRALEADARRAGRGLWAC